MKKLIFMIFSIVMAVSLNSCTKDSTSNTYAYQVRMTDHPGHYDEVNIDLKGVEITGSKGQTVTLNTNTGIYDLLKLSNGLNAIIATSSLNDSKVEQIRLILGSNNTIVVDGTSYSLSTPSAEQSGLKLSVNQTLQADIQNEILIDFDASTSIIQTGNGNYKLKPVLRTVVTAITGNLKGSITPIGIMATVSATSATNEVFSSNTNAMGQFQISGLPPGVYTFKVTPPLPSLPITKSNVTIVASATNNIGIINL